MKKLIASLLIVAGVAAHAEPIPLTIRSTGNTDLLIPTSMTYRQAVPETTNVVTELVWKQGSQIEVPVSTNVVPEVTEAIIINADYRLKSGVPVVDITLDGIRTEITPTSSPKFALTIEVPTATFSGIVGAEQTAGIVAVLQTAGKIIPNATLTETIRAVAVQVLATEE